MARFAIAALAIMFTVLTAGCGTGQRSSTTGTQAAPTATIPPTATKTTDTGGPGALQAEARATAAGDIPDNQVFLVFHDVRARYSIKYPEGWAQQGSGNEVVFRDKNNIVRVVVLARHMPTVTSVLAAVRQLPGARVLNPPHRVSVAHGAAIQLEYTTKSPPNPVTGKRVTLVVDRYYLSRIARRRSNGSLAVIDLGTPQGVDNVDAYRLMVESFMWR